MFNNLSERLDSAFKLLKGEGQISEINIATTIKEIRRALVDADVNYSIAKEFTDKVKEKAIGERVITSVTPGQLMVKIVKDGLVDLMGGTESEIDLTGNPTVILIAGLLGLLIGTIVYFKKKYGLTEKGCFLRIGTASEPMSQPMIDKLFASRTRNSIGKIKSNRQDIGFEQLRIYYEEKGKPLNNQFKRNLELQTEDGLLNYAAYLLADENNNSIKLAKYDGVNRVELIENNEFGYCSLMH
jgi:hypothetical protein